MSTKFVLSQRAFEKLLKNLVAFEEEYQSMVDDYYPQYTKERESFVELLTEYIKKLNTTLKNITFREKCDNYFPFVIIGSEVEIQDIDDGEAYKYRIVAPTERDIENDYISFLSPVGRALLLKEKDETVVVNTPNGVYRYRIKSIKL
ncbi:GreA/GreB family elongation factor [Petroclostridium sp. X23]|uniref:GreA/GreB family elongation factor n=1 Tax=Petroclostridium sp. X23 TaxID=3045146 RepID=UPI0024AC938D|nr:GreA/GreB family elongation factor [Petroclostridium sp. X23]WHH58706.1 GreA/GreB family elongation factor [Petroclostridium sp. X23]